MLKITWRCVSNKRHVITPPSGEYLIALFMILSITCINLSVSISTHKSRLVKSRVILYFLFGSSVGSLPALVVSLGKSSSCSWSRLIIMSNRSSAYPKNSFKLTYSRFIFAVPWSIRDKLNRSLIIRIIRSVSSWVTFKKLGASSGSCHAPSFSASI